MSYFFTYRKQNCTVCLGLILCVAAQRLSIHCPYFFKVTTHTQKQTNKKKKKRNNTKQNAKPVFLLIVPQCQGFCVFSCTDFYGGYILLMVTLVSVTEREQQQCLCSIPSV